MASLLFIHGGDALAARVFAEERRGYWSAALPLLLEQHGYLDFATAGPEALEDPSTWADHDVVLVARLPQSAWTEKAVRLATGRTQTMVEGPLPKALEDHLGVSGEAADQVGSVVPADDELRLAAEAFGAGAGGTLDTASSRPVEMDDSLSWTRQGVPIEAGQAEAWRAAGWDARQWSAGGDATVLAEWVTGGSSPERSPAIVRAGALTGCSFGLFAFLGQCRTCQPANGSEYMSWPRSYGIEAMLLALIDEMYARAGASRPRVLPWPMDRGWVMNVRHDIDRTMDRKAAKELLRMHKELGTSATFYARASHLTGRSRSAAERVKDRLARRVDKGVAESAAVLRTFASSPGHEVAHHTERIWKEGAAEERRLRKATGRSMPGTAAHGDPNCFRWQGAPNILWAESRSHLFTEFISHAHFHPHRPAVLTKTGEIRFLDVICLPHHASFDASTKEGDTLEDSVRAAAQQSVATKGMLQVMNHPDLNRDALRELLSELPRDGRLDWTAGQTAEWWRASHVQGNVVVDTKKGGRLQVRAKAPLLGAMVEIREPDGTTSMASVSLESGKAATVEDFVPKAAGEPRPAA